MVKPVFTICFHKNFMTPMTISARKVQSIFTFIVVLKPVNFEIMCLSTVLRSDRGFKVYFLHRSTEQISEICGV